MKLHQEFIDTGPLHMTPTEFRIPYTGTKGPLQVKNETWWAWSSGWCSGDIRPVRQESSIRKIIICKGNYNMNLLVPNWFRKRFCHSLDLKHQPTICICLGQKVIFACDCPRNCTYSEKWAIESKPSLTEPEALIPCCSAKLMLRWGIRRKWSDCR